MYPQTLQMHRKGYSLLADETPTAAPKMLILGDFNLHHNRWEIICTATHSTQACTWMNWAQARNLALLTPFNIPTHSKGGTIDLTWATPTLRSAFPTETTIAEDLVTTSDYISLRTTLIAVMLLYTKPQADIVWTAQIKLNFFKH